MDDDKYPWFGVVTGDDIEQGDIFEGCPVFIPLDGLSDWTAQEVHFRVETRDVIVLSQTCDMVKGREKIQETLLCTISNRSELKEPVHLATRKGMEDARRGNLPPFHLLAECSLNGFQKEVRIVDFRRVFSLPISFVRARASGFLNRLRLLPQYREHLSQAFARYFMRVGMPSDIPPFTSSGKSSIRK